MRPDAVRGGAAAGPHPGRAAAARAGGARAGRADGAAGVAAARRGSVADGEPVLLLDQDRARWDRLLVGRGLAALRPRRGARRRRSGPYALQAAIAACHARARTAEETDWERIAALYDGAGPADALAGGRAEPGGRGRDGVRSGRPAWSSSTRSPTSPRCAATTCCRACAATCSSSSGRRDEARAEFERAAALTAQRARAALLLARARECA